jgi:alkaline phosphatase D
MKFIFTLSVSLFSLTCMGQKPYLDVLSKFYNPALKPFYHGVASGDPTPEAVVIWTKLTPETEAPVSIHWQIAFDSLFSSVLQQGDT